MELLNTYQDNEIPVMTFCTLCNKCFELKWSIGYPCENFCSTDCRQRWEQIKRTGYPKYPEYFMKFWEDWAHKKSLENVQILDKSKVAHWLKLKKCGSKVAQKVAQKSGSFSSLGKNEPLSHEPILGKNLEPLFPVEPLEEGK